VQILSTIKRDITQNNEDKKKRRREQRYDSHIDQYDPT